MLHPLCIKASNQVEPHSHGLSHSPSSFFQLGTVTSPTLSCDGASLTLTTVRKHLRVGAVSRHRKLSVPSPCTGCSASSSRGTNSPQPKSQGVPVFSVYPDAHIPILFQLPADLVFKYITLVSSFLLVHPMGRQSRVPHLTHQPVKLGELGAKCSTSTTVPPFLPVAAKVTRDIKAGIRELHQTTYRQSQFSDKGKIPLTATLVHYPSFRLPPSRGDLRLLTTVYSGHSDLNYFRHIQKLVDSPMCPHCPSAPETSEHFVGRCPAYSHIRFSMLGTRSASLGTIASLFNPVNVLHFIKETGRLSQEDTVYCK